MYLPKFFREACDPINFDVDTSAEGINWLQFPEFDLPFTIVYHGDIPSDSLFHQLNHGFSHIFGPDLDYKDTLMPDQRAYTWTGVAGADNWAEATNQPWRMIKSPWGNDIEGYRIKWYKQAETI